MNWADIRRDRLQELILRKYKTQAAFANETGIAPNYVSRMVSRGRNRKHITAEYAREIEKKARLPELYLDRLEGAVRSTRELPEAYNWPFSFDPERYQALKRTEREQIERRVLEMVEDFEGAGKRPIAGKKTIAHR